MNNRYQYGFFVLFILILLTGCKSRIKEQEDSIYSRHLQRHVDLTIISTQIPDDKSGLNLLLFNHAKDLRKIEAKKIIDSLDRENLIQPLVLVGIDGNQVSDYGITDLAATDRIGDKASKYGDFIINELYPFIKKKTVTRKFKSIVICGSSLAGTSAFDIGWQHADRIDKVAVFSGNFSYTNAGNANNADSLNDVLEKINQSRKRPTLSYWMYASEQKGNQIYKNTQTLISIIRKKNTGSSADIQFSSDKTGNNDVHSWRQHFAEFLLWAFGK